MRILSLHTYPVKSCRRVDHEAIDVEPWGLAGDRRWLIVDPDGATALTQRELPGLATIRPRPAAGGLVLSAEGLPDLPVPAPVAPDVTVDVWGARVEAARAGAAADAWLSGALGRQVWLAHLDDPTRRAVDPRYGEPGDRVNFADGYPVLLASEASLAALNAELGDAGAVPMTRFRPNVVIDGGAPWEEDGWVGERIAIGPVMFRVPKPCGRCVTTTTDQETGERGREPLRTLGRIRLFRDGRPAAGSVVAGDRAGGALPAGFDGVLFAVNLIPDHVGRIAVGDEVKVATR